MALAIDRADGNVRWQKGLNEKLPHEGGHFSGSLASASPVTDGGLLYAYFGSHGLYAVSYEGDPVWEFQPGTMQSKHAHGEGSSPALYEDTLLVNWDHEGASFLVALDKKTGETRWKEARPEVTSWATPLVVGEGGEAQVVLAGTPRLAKKHFCI